MKYELNNGAVNQISTINVNVSNPTDELLDLLGIGKILVETEQPAYESETEYLSESYTETETEITQHWNIFPKQAMQGEQSEIV